MCMEHQTARQSSNGACSLLIKPRTARQRPLRPGGLCQPLADVHGPLIGQQQVNVPSGRPNLREQACWGGTVWGPQSKHACPNGIFIGLSRHPLQTNCGASATALQQRCRITDLPAQSRNVCIDEVPAAGAHRRAVVPLRRPPGCSIVSAIQIGNCQAAHGLDAASAQVVYVRLGRRGQCL